MNAKGFTGTGTLLRLAARRDRIQLPVWLLGMAGVLSASAASVTDLYGTEQARTNYALTTSPSIVARAFNGLTSGPELGAILMTETYLTMAVLAALMSTFAVVRHTRQNEETGRAEMIGACVVGRYAGLTAALMLTILANVVLAALVSLVLIGAVGLTTTGSVLIGATLAAIGIVFAGVAAVTCQVAESTRAASGLAGGFLGLSFLVRAVGDAFGDVSADGLAVISGWPSWVSPMGWGQQVRPFRDDAWWLLGLPAGFFVILVAVAFGLIRHRDVGTGMLPVRPGPAVAAPSLLSPLGLAWRLQRGMLLGWAVGMATVGLVLGGIANEVDEMTKSNPEMQDMLRELAGGGGSLEDVFFAGTLGICGIAVGAYVVQALLRLHAEEASGRVEPVLATAVGRTRWLLSHVTCAVLGSATLLVLVGVTAGLVYGVANGEIAKQLYRVTVAAVTWLPATLALGGFVLLCFALLPRWATALSWGGLTVCLLMGQIGALLDLPQPVLNLSPFTHVPALPAADFIAAPMLVLSGAAVASIVAGSMLFRRRDLAI